MNYFIVEGMIQNAEKMNDDTMQEHISYTQKAMDNGIILLSGLKNDMSGGIFVMKAETIEDIEAYLSNEPFKKYKIQDYKIIGFEPHYFNQSPNEWFNK